jgi:hypothetical protein
VGSFLNYCRLRRIFTAPRNHSAFHSNIRQHIGDLAGKHLTKEKFMEPQDLKASRSTNAVQLLRRLDDIGAIKLDVLLSKSAEIKDIVSAAGGGGSGIAELDEWDRICYPFVIRIGPRRDFELVTVVDELRNLGFDVKARR